MKPDIHPVYVATEVTCTCGTTFVTRSTAAERRHPRRDLLELPPLLHGQAAHSGHRWTRCPLREAVRQEGAASRSALPGAMPPGRRRWCVEPPMQVVARVDRVRQGVRMFDQVQALLDEYVGP